MDSYHSGQAVALVIPLGITGYADQAFWRVEAADGSPVVAEEELAAADILEGQVTLSIDASLNTLAGSETRALRRVLVRFKSFDETNDAWVEVEASYLITPAQALAVQVNSFMTYGEALLLSSEITGLDGFLAASKADRLAALAEAWRSLITLRFDLDPGNTRHFTHVTDFLNRTPGDLSLYSAAEYLALDARFVAASRRAQLIEADWLLSRGDDPANQGLLSKKVGESTDVYRTSKPLALIVSRRTFQALAGWVRTSPRISRG